MPEARIRSSVCQWSRPSRKVDVRARAEERGVDDPLHPGGGRRVHEIQVLGEPLGVLARRTP